MFHAAMQAAIEGARTFAQMDEAARRLWEGHGAGVLRDEEAQALAERLQGRRSALREGNRDGIRPLPVPGLVGARVSLFPPRRAPVSPDRLASRARRRLLACSGPMPPALAARFTEGQRAVLRIVADAVAEKALCDLCIDAIAARAGVCRRLAQGAIRLAEGDGLLTVEERRHRGRRNSPNLVRIISREWQAWMRRGRKVARQAEAGTETRGDVIGCRSLHPTDSDLFNPGKTAPDPVVQGLPDGRNRARRAALPDAGKPPAPGKGVETRCGDRSHAVRLERAGFGSGNGPGKTKFGKTKFGKSM